MACRSVRRKTALMGTAAGSHAPGMKAIQLTAPSLDAFRFVTLPDPVFSRGEVLVRLRAASLNFIDVAAATGAYPIPRFPIIPVADGAGEVVAVGDGVSDLVAGDRVLLHSKPAWIGGPIDAATSRVMRGISLPGSLAEYAVLPANAMVRTPEHLSDEAAATLPICGTTAQNALRAGDVGPGSTVLLLGTGGTSIFTLQLAKARGARVIITSSSKERLERARSLGADETIDYVRTPEWDRAVLELTSGRGADLVVETGGAKTLSRSVTATAPGGTIYTIGFLSGTAASVDLLPIIVKGLRVIGNNTGSVHDLTEAARAVAATRIQPVIDQVFAPSEAAEAYRMLVEGGRHFGKMVFALGRGFH
jgi:NADPH:quinone reductase-like Zn-dependent oxidoreductase